jgi:tungstate transport system ATP-binding protein
MEDLEQVLRETRITTIFVTHDRMEAFRLAGRIGVMKAGEILQTGSPDEVMNHPVSEFVASFVGIETILPGRVVGRNGANTIVSVAGLEVQVPGKGEAGQEVILCIRPEHVNLSGLGSEALPGLGNRLTGRVEKIMPVGPYQKVRLSCGFSLVAYVPNHTVSAIGLKDGSEVEASFAPEAVHVIPKGPAGARPA